MHNDLCYSDTTLMSEVTLTNEAAMRIFMDNPREESRYFTIAVPRERMSADETFDPLEAKLSPEELAALSYSNSCFFEHFFVADIRDYAFREGKDGRIYYVSLPKFLVLKTYVPNFRFYKQILHALHGIPMVQIS